MPQFVLPPGYSFEPPDTEEAHVLSDSVPDKGYGGADISQEWDLNGVHHVGCNAWGPGDPSFRWRMFKEVSDGVYVEVQLTFLSTGRGEMQVHLYDGKAWAIAWKDSVFNYDVVPGFAAFPPMSELIGRIQALEDILLGLEPGEPLPKPTSGVYLPVAEPAGYKRVWSAAIASGAKHTITPAMGSVLAYNARIVAEGSVNARARVGPTDDPTTALTAVITVAQKRDYETGLVTAGPNGTLVLTADNGPIDRCWVDIYGVIRK